MIDWGRQAELLWGWYPPETEDEFRFVLEKMVTKYAERGRIQRLDAALVLDEFSHQLYSEGKIRVDIG